MPHRSPEHITEVQQLDDTSRHDGNLNLNPGFAAVERPVGVAIAGAGVSCCRGFVCVCRRTCRAIQTWQIRAA